MDMVEQKTSDTYEDDDCEYDDCEDDDLDDYDWCYECTGLGDDYYVNEDGTLECRCDNCMYNQQRSYNE